jgi:hypothetical protein
VAATGAITEYHVAFTEERKKKDSIGNGSAEDYLMITQSNNMAFSNAILHCSLEYDSGMRLSGMSGAVHLLSDIRYDACYGTGIIQTTVSGLLKAAII